MRQFKQLIVVKSVSYAYFSVQRLKRTVLKIPEICSEDSCISHHNVIFQPTTKNKELNLILSHQINNTVLEDTCTGKLEVYHFPALIKAVRVQAQHSI